MPVIICACVITSYSIHYTKLYDYQYLAESIRMHPDQDTLKGMMEGVGFEDVSYYNLTQGVA